MICRTCGERCKWIENFTWIHDLDMAGLLASDHMPKPGISVPLAIRNTVQPYAVVNS